MQDAATLSRQKQILSLREDFLSNIKNLRDGIEINKRVFEQLREVSPAKLVPVLIQRNNSDWIVAYLVQEIGDDGKRILVKADKWRILRARKSAQMIKVPGALVSDFDTAVNTQQNYFCELTDLLKKAKSPAIKNKKVKNALSREQRIGRTPA